MMILIILSNHRMSDKMASIPPIAITAVLRYGKYSSMVKVYTERFDPIDILFILECAREKAIGHTLVFIFVFVFHIWILRVFNSFSIMNLILVMLRHY